MNDTRIEWAGKTWNPVTGCSPASEGCARCYAATIARRFWGSRKFSDIKFHPDRLDEPRKIKEPCRIFAGSMTDLAHEKVKYEWWRAIVGVFTDCDRHTFYVLTKRAQRLKELIDGCGVPPNVWCGVTVESQAHVDRLEILASIHCRHRFVSVEPMLGPVEIPPKLLKRMGWVICGRETGGKAREMEDRWALVLRERCRRAHVPFFFKNDWPVELANSKEIHASR
jgi:protein gp37